MRCLLLFGLLGLSLGMDFDCTKSTGGVDETEAVNNAMTQNYELVVSSHEYTKDSKITVTLRGPGIQHFQLQAREPCSVGDCERLHPLGQWEHEAFARDCGERSRAVMSGSGLELTELSAQWSGPVVDGEMMPVHVVAVVVDKENRKHINIFSQPIFPLIERAVEEEEQEEPVHNDDESEGERRLPEEEEEEDEGPVEDPNDEERREKELHDAAVARDLRPEEEEEEPEESRVEDDHGLRREEELAALRREKEREMEELEMNEEGDWGNREAEEKEREEEEFNREMYEYEKEQAEQEKRRLEMIEWEIRDKEEHDRWLAEQEENRSPKDSAEEKTPEEEVEIDVEEEIIVVEASSGAALISSVLMVAVVAVLAM